MSTVAERTHEKITEAFIDDNPADIVLTRRKRVQTTAGGFVWVDVDPLLAQKGRMVFSSNKGDNLTRTLPEGQVVDVTATLVFAADADVQRGDKFTYEGTDWVVGSVARTPKWRISCEVGHA